MFNLDKVKGIIFDYGGTIDSNGTHWAEVLWDEYRNQNVPVTKEQFREAYVYGERYLATHPVVQPHHNFYDLLKIKVDLQINYLIDNKILEDNDKSDSYILAISEQCYNFVRKIISNEIDILEALRNRYPMVLVSNFYGNVQAVLEDFDLLRFFDEIIESAVVGVRKPDPAIFGLGVEKLNLPASEIVVIGDSYSKDIVPARKNGCQTIWLKGPGWGDDEPDATADIIITDFEELKSVFQIG
ncbi:MAG: HAD family hydrolase [Dysgonomonas sp.]|nr:HAD family hydrolase [Dysgonomonas sp.]